MNAAFAASATVALLPRFTPDGALNLWGRCRFTPVVQAALLDYSDFSQCAKENFPRTSRKTAYHYRETFVHARGR